MRLSRCLANSVWVFLKRSEPVEFFRRLTKIDRDWRQMGCSAIPWMHMSTPPALLDAATTERAFPSSSGEMFGGYFADPHTWSFKKGDLLDARARRIFEGTALAVSVDAYPFHMPLQAKAGPCVTADGHEMLMMSSYDYLGLIGDPRIDGAAQRAIARYGTSTSGARLLTGHAGHSRGDGTGSCGVQGDRSRAYGFVRLHGQSSRDLWVVRTVRSRDSG